MKLLNKFFKTLFCDHEWKLIAEGTIGRFIGEKQNVMGHFKDYQCEKCKNGKRVVWEIQ